MPETSLGEQPEAEAPALIELTLEQVRELDQLQSQWHQVARDRPANKVRVKEALSRLYKMIGIDMPAVLWFEGPRQLVTMNTLLALRVIASGTHTDLLNQIRTELKDPGWYQDWQNLDQQLEGVALPENGAAEFPNSLRGADVSTEISTKFIIKIVEAGEKLAKQLSLPAKLKLRQVLRHADGNDNLLRRRETTPLIVTQFGLIQLRALIGDGLTKEFTEQLMPETQKALNSLCSEKVPATRALFGLAVNQEPVAKLFESLNDRLNVPTWANDLQPIVFAIRHLPVVLPEEITEPIMDWVTLKEDLFHVQFFEKLCIVCDAPDKAMLNERNQLHNDSGPAMTFRDGCKIYAWNGVVVPSTAVDAIEEITVEQIEKEANVEVRRILIQQYGMARYLEDSGARKIDEDEYGVLYRKTLPHDEPVVVVRVVNPTPEPDGTNKFYFLRVPPYITSARSAVAWTFEMSEQDYQPAKQS